MLLHLSMLESKPSEHELWWERSNIWTIADPSTSEAMGDFDLGGSSTLSWNQLHSRWGNYPLQSRVHWMVRNLKDSKENKDFHLLRWLWKPLNQNHLLTELFKSAENIGQETKHMKGKPAQLLGCSIKGWLVEVSVSPSTPQLASPREITQRSP